MLSKALSIGALLLSLVPNRPGRIVMHRRIEELQQYHAKKSKALKELQSSISLLAETENLPALVGKIQELLSAFDADTESEHHRKEELILEELRKTEAPIHRKVDELSGDHRAFAKILGRLHQLIEENKGDPDLLSVQIGEFIKHYEDHAGTEELIFFPMADQYLEESNWQNVEKQWD